MYLLGVTKLPRTMQLINKNVEKMDSRREELEPFKNLGKGENLPGVKII